VAQPAPRARRVHPDTLTLLPCSSAVGSTFFGPPRDAGLVAVASVAFHASSSAVTHKTTPRTRCARPARLDPPVLRPRRHAADVHPPAAVGPADERGALERRAAELGAGHRCDSLEGEPIGREGHHVDLPTAEVHRLPQPVAEPHSAAGHDHAGPACPVPLATTRRGQDNARTRPRQRVQQGNHQAEAIVGLPIHWRARTGHHSAERSWAHTTSRRTCATLVPDSADLRRRPQAARSVEAGITIDRSPPPSSCTAMILPNSASSSRRCGCPPLIARFTAHTARLACRRLRLRFRCGGLRLRGR
jgi:hypothetical protein